ncbi:MAG: hypothetical protein EOO38_28295 [Cytophagaceae bacterium]|nr:MAG: hypothetical protein EOO38_28295 [Cytophagaceae bacterium]
MARLGPEERLKLTQAAHKTSRGSKKTEENLIRRALGVQQAAKQSDPERAIENQLNLAGVPTVPALAVFKYNIDLACPDVLLAIEVQCNWHTSEVKAKADMLKLHHLIRHGWLVVYVAPESFNEAMVHSIRALYEVRRHLSSGSSKS